MRKIIALLLTLLLLTACAVCAEAAVSSLADLKAPGVKIGVDQGSAAELTARAELPEADFSYFTDKFMGYEAVAQGKIDAFVYDYRQMSMAIQNGLQGVRLLDDCLGDTVAIAVGISPVSKIPQLEQKLNQFIAELRADGTLEDMFRRWAEENIDVMPEIALPENPQYTLTVATSGIVPPFSYYKGTELTGYDIELARRFAAWLGADLQLGVYDYGAIIPAAVSGKADCIMANLNATSERWEALSFSDTLFEEKIGILVKDDGTSAAVQDLASRLDALNIKRMGIVTGTSFEAPTLEYFPSSEHLYFSTNSDLVTALTSNKIDGFLADEPVIRVMCKEVPGITYLPEMITQDDYAFGFGKKGARADKIRGQFNEMLAELMTDGTMNALYEKWFGDDEAAKVVDMTGFSGENGKLNVVTTCASVPFSYIKDGQKAGIAMEMVEMFCRRYGYTPYIEDVDVAARIPGLVTGKYDMCAAPMTITEERKESINFSDPYYKGGIVLAMRKEDAPAQAAETVPAAVQDTGSALASLNVKRMGIVTGTSFEAPTLQYFPDSEHLYYNSYTDVAAALVNNKIDGFLGDEPALRMLVKEVQGITCLPEKLVNDDYAFGFGKSGERADKLRSQFDEMLAEIKADGTLDALGEKWFGDDEAAKTVDLKNGFSGENGKLNVVTTATDVPFSYVKDNQYVGMSIELVEMFCRRYGYTPVIADVDFSARMPGLVSGKYDMCASSMAITEERKESISFSAPFYQGGIVLAMRTEDAPAQAAETKAENDFSQLAGKRIGVQTGTIVGPLVEAALPTAKISYFNTTTDVLTALRTGKVDAWCHDEPVIRFLGIDTPGLTILDGYLSESNLAAIFAKTEAGQKLRDEYSAFVEQLWADGTMKVIDSIWFGDDEDRRTVLDYENLPATNGILRMAADTTQIPFAYVKDNRAMGYDIDIAARFCQAYGYRLEVVQMNFDGVLASVQQGKCDFAACCITITEERAESVLFSSPDYYGGLVMAVMGDSAAPKQTASASDTISSLNDLANARIGVQTGTPYDALINKLLPNATISYYSTYPDMVAALEANKIDAFPGDEPVMIFMAAEDSRLAVLPEHLEECEMAYVLPKTEAGEKLGSVLNAWIASMNASGEMDQLIKKWTEGPESEKTVPDYASFPAPNGVLKLATEGAYTPMNYFRGSELVGLEIDMTARFCEDCGYGLTVEAMNFDGILPAITAGKADFAAASILITEERKESVNFSDPYYIGGTVMIVPSSKASSQEATQGLTALSDLANARIGVQTGSTFDEIVLEAFPEAKISYFNSYPDMAAAMEANKIDAFPGDEPVIQLMAAENPKLAVLQERMDSFDFGIALPKTEAGEKLLGEINAWLASAKANGELQKITDKWITGPESEKTLPDYASFPAPNGVLTLATEAAYAPMCYFRGNEVVGMEIDMLARFCEANGYGLKVVPMQFDAILPAIQSGKADFAAAGLTITEERKESVNFSDPYYTGGTVMAVLKSRLQPKTAPQPAAPAANSGTAPSAPAPAPAAPAVQKDTFWDGIVASFNKTFIREDRWKLFTDGVLTTLLITVLSILCGTALGFAVFMLCRRGNVIANNVTKFSMWLVQGMPMVVLLMILYYIIFGSVAISGLVVAVIGFTLTFGASVFGLLKMGVGAVDNGQYEAAYALGYSNRRTFFRIILPQALPHVMSAYKGEIVGLIKATAIVGYIAVQDLTKMGDIVRSRTYEAFFPLIAITVIYFVLEGLLSLLVRGLEYRLNPKKRKSENILKGVNIHD